MRVGYAKLGRSILLDPTKWGAVGGDNEPLYMLQQLAARNPDVEWVVAGRHSGDPGNLPPNVTVPELPKDHADVHAAIRDLYGTLDGAVIHLGQHGTSNVPVPQDKDPTKLTNPQEWSRRYAGPIIDGLNSKVDGAWDPVWLVQDPRNYLKARDVKWYPKVPILGQYEWCREQTHYRYGDPRTPEECLRSMWSKPAPNGFWTSLHSYEYSQLELVGVPLWERREWPAFEDRERFGIIINENRAYVKVARKPIMRDWVLPLEPSFIHGKWSDEALAELGVEIEPVHYTKLPETFARAKSTLTTPASGSQWATAKPWEAFALGVICFFHPLYDTQGNIIPTLEQIRKDHDKKYDDQLRHLVGWLRVETPEQLKLRVDAVHDDPSIYCWLRDAQHAVLDRAREEQRCLNMIEQQLGLHEPR